MRLEGVFSQNLSGESEIRTRDTLLGYTRFPGVPLQPLEHLSEEGLQRYNYYLKLQNNGRVFAKEGDF